MYAAAGTYPVKLVVISNKGCTDSITKDITVYAQPEFTLLPSSDTAFCQGGEVTFTVQGDTGLTYQWLRNDTLTAETGSTFRTDSAGRYHVIATSSSNCFVPSYVVNVTIYSVPDAYITPANDLDLCPGVEVIFTAPLPPDTGISYQWLNNGIPMGVNIEYITDSAGSYQLVISNANCADTSPVTQVTYYALISVSVAPGDIDFCQEKK